MMVRFILFFILILAVEFYFLQAVKTFSQDFSQNKKQIVLWTAYLFAAFSIIVALTAIVYPPTKWSVSMRFISSAVFIILLCKILGISFLIIDDIIRLFRWVFSLFKGDAVSPEIQTEGISRLKFLSQVAITFTVIPAIGFLYGIVKGAYKYRVHNVKVPSSKIPEEFNGFRIVQLSDIHVGSFMENSHLNDAFDIVMKQNADLILFTGDLVNNVAEETEGYADIFKRLKAPHGVFSVLGNHDYGDYVEWESAQHKKDNLDKLKTLQASFGWRLLMNEHVSIEKNGQKIALLGIENWGGSHRFPKYGKMDLAHKDTSGYPYKILMSHDPSHWDAQVQPEYPDVDLTLSGHTHGMQLGIEIPGIKWSPAKWVYKNWAGLYKSGEQFLYVNRGLGFLGYPGRLGIWPEITVIELQRV
jgi:uncharacterized protein